MSIWGAYAIAKNGRLSRKICLVGAADLDAYERLFKAAGIDGVQYLPDDVATAKRDFEHWCADELDAFARRTNEPGYYLDAADEIDEFFNAVLKERCGFVAGMDATPPADFWRFVAEGSGFSR